MSLFLKISDVDTIRGAATVADIAGHKGLMPITSVEWGGIRPIMMEVGAMSFGEVGSATIENVSIFREADGGSAFLQTMFYQPGASGRSLSIIEARTDRTGGGLVPRLIITLSDARLAEYALSASDSGATETLVAAYTEIALEHYYEEADGTIKKGSTVKFDLAKARLASGVKIGSG